MYKTRYVTPVLSYIVARAFTQLPFWEFASFGAELFIGCMCFMVSYWALEVATRCIRLDRRVRRRQIKRAHRAGTRLCTQQKTYL